MNIVPILKSTKQLLVKENGWTQKFFARHADGQPCGYLREASCYCLEGAFRHELFKVTKFGQDSCDAVDLLDKTFKKITNAQSVVEWNDVEGRTQEQVIQIVDQLISDLEAGELAV
jgi:hypothetical protein